MSPPRDCRPLRALFSALAALSLLALAALPAASQTVRPDFPLTDGTVLAIAQVGNTVYIGGTFSYVGPASGACAPLDKDTGAPLALPKVSGTVNAALPDGAGGWFLGGSFTQVAGVARANVAHIDASGALTSWNPGVDNTVFAMALDADVLYVGGGF